MTRISGPMRDRFDMRITLRPVDPEALIEGDTPAPFTIDAFQEAILRQARRAQRWGIERPWNAALPPGLLPEAIDLMSDAQSDLLRCGQRFRLSARGIHRALRVARTIADLAGADAVAIDHMREGLSYRE